MSVKILVTYKNEHKLLKSEVLIPTQTGRALSNKKFDGMLGDDTGDNISEKNGNYSEVSAQYWAWKNYEALGNPEYIGFMHYRRHFIFNNNDYQPDEIGCVHFKSITPAYLQEVGLNDSDIECHINGCDVVIGSQIDLSKVGVLQGTRCTPRDAFDANLDLRVEDYDLMVKTVKELYPEFSSVVDKVENGHYQHWYNMFIMRKELFFRYNEYLFSILFELEKKIDTSMYGTNAQRIFGYLSERLLTFFIEKLRDENRFVIRESFITFIEETQNDESLKPVFKENYATIVFSCSDYYVPYLSVCLQSLIENSKNYHNYDIIILNRDISIFHQQKLCKIITKENISLRFLKLPSDLEDVFSDKNLSKEAHFTIETYFRIFLPKLLPDYQKFVYLDADALVLGDIYDLHEVDLKGFPVAACIDSSMSGFYNINYHEVRSYFKDVLCLEQPYQYFQAGVMIFDADQFRQKKYQEPLLQLAKNIKTQCADQCILNMFFKTNILQLDLSWNCQTEYDILKNLRIHSAIPVSIYKNYLNAKKKPNIIHYAGVSKPWLSVDEDMAEIWWKYAQRTPFYEQIIYRPILGEIVKVKEVVINEMTELKKIVLLVSEQENQKRKYRKYRILNKITFGDMKKRYKRKRTEALMAIREIQKAINKIKI